MALLTTPSGAFPTSLIYITVGTLMDIWTIVTMVFYPPQTPAGQFWLVGFLVTGLALFVIGIFLGQIGRAARNAELPPTEVTPQLAKATEMAAEHPPVVAMGNSPVQPLVGADASHPIRRPI